MVASGAPVVGVQSDPEGHRLRPTQAANARHSVAGFRMSGPQMERPPVRRSTAGAVPTSMRRSDPSVSAGSAESALSPNVSSVTCIMTNGAKAWGKPPGRARANHGVPAPDARALTAPEVTQSW